MINGKLIKVCGMRVADNIAEVESLEVDLMGFIFYHKSPRYVFDMPAYLPTKAKRVGVFVNETKEMVRTIADRYALDYIQLHGNESPAYCKSLQQCGMKVFKAFSVDKPKDLNGVEEYHGLWTTLCLTPSVSNTEARAISSTGAYSTNIKETLLFC
jgi:phosphoribosylanthranilate isomerase